jgi:hypothetical protein
VALSGKPGTSAGAGGRAVPDPWTSLGGWRLG